jgi:hypothetical protein
MTCPPDDQALAESIRALRARNLLARTVRAGLKGSGLEVRERDNQLVITSPGHPDHGRIYITYARHEVSHARTIWAYLGQFTTDEPASDEPAIDIGAIIRTLTGYDSDGDGGTL